MAKQKRAGGLLGALGSDARKSFDGHKGDDTNFGAGADLPPGIEGGIAQLVDCKFDKYKSGKMEGKYFFYAAGIVKEPQEHGGISIEGLRTQIMEPMCSTPNRTRQEVGDHLEWVLNELRKLGVDTGNVDFEDLEEVAASLKEEQPHFRFRTWKGDATPDFPNPRVNHQWRGACEHVEDDTSDDVVDATDDADVEEDTTSDSISNDADENLPDLARLADDGDEAAEEKLQELAEKAGIDASDDKYDTWLSVALALEGESTFGGSDEKEEEQSKDFTPEKGEVFMFKPPRARKPLACEITAVFAGKQTCNLKSQDTGRSFKGIPWDKLEEE